MENIFSLTVAGSLGLFLMFASCSGGSCPYRWVSSEETGTCLMFSYTRRSWTAARSKCQLTFGGDLVKIVSEQMNSLVADQLSHRKGKEYWIGLNSMNTMGRFKWLDERGDPEYESWYDGEPNTTVPGEKECVKMSKAWWHKAKWAAGDCQKECKYICEKPMDACPGKWVDSVHSGSCVQIISKNRQSWKEARATCQQYGGDLVKADNKEMFKFISAQVRKSPGSQYWIGLSDRRNEGTFVWVGESEPAKFTKWHARRKGVGHRIRQDCVYLDADYRTVYMNDEDCKFKLKYICERPKE